MGMGLPMIISYPEGEATGIIRGTGAGLVVVSESPSDLAASVLRLYKDTSCLESLADHSQKAAYSYDRKILSDKMLGVFDLAIMGHCKNVSC